MLVIRGVNVFPSEVEAAVLEDPALAGQYQIWVDRRGTMAELSVTAELARAQDVPRRHEVEKRLAERLAERLRIRIEVSCADPGSLPRSELGKAKRVFDVEVDAPAT
jgi:phenylacetate-CoA ligase